MLAVEFEPDDADLRVEYASLLLQVGELDVAATQAARARELDPGQCRRLERNCESAPDNSNV